MNEKGLKIAKKRDQASRRVLKKAQIGRFRTLHEEIVELPVESVQPCPLIPDYKDPTESTIPIVVRTPAAYFCIDGFNLIEQAKATGQATIRCYVSQIQSHSDTELAIRKTAIRIIPQGGKCSYAELVRNTYRLYQALKETSDDLISFSHGGDRRGIDFTSSRENNIRTILATRLDKSPTTIAKYLQHGDCLNDTAMALLIDAGAPKLFFEAFQVQKHVEIAASRAEKKEETAIVEDISNQVSTWLNEFQQPTTSVNSQPEGQQSSRTNQTVHPAQSNSSTNRRRTPVQNLPSANPGADKSPSIDPVPINAEGVDIELRSIGGAIIEIADNQQLTITQKIETVRKHIISLSTLLQRLMHVGKQEGNGKGGTV